MFYPLSAFIHGFCQTSKQHTYNHWSTRQKNAPSLSLQICTTSCQHWKDQELLRSFKCPNSLLACHDIQYASVY